MITSCSRCGANHLERGDMHPVSQRNVATFRPAGIKFLTLKQGIPITAVLCMQCGLIELEADPVEVKKLLKPKTATIPARK